MQKVYHKNLNGRACLEYNPGMSEAQKGDPNTERHKANARKYKELYDREGAGISPLPWFLDHMIKAHSNAVKEKFQAYGEKHPGAFTPDNEMELEILTQGDLISVEFFAIIKELSMTVADGTFELPRVTTARNEAVRGTLLRSYTVDNLTPDILEREQVPDQIMGRLKQHVEKDPTFSDALKDPSSLPINLQKYLRSTRLQNYTTRFALEWKPLAQEFLSLADISHSPRTGKPKGEGELTEESDYHVSEAPLTVADMAQRGFTEEQLEALKNLARTRRSGDLPKSK